MGPSPKPKSNPRAGGAYKQRLSSSFFTHSASPEFRAQTTRSIQLPSEKDQKLLSFRKESTIYRSGARSIQSSSARSATFEIKQSSPRIIQVIKDIESENCSIKFRDCTHIQHQYKFIFLLIISCLILFRLEICVYKFLARSMGHLYLSSLSPNYNSKPL